LKDLILISKLDSTVQSKKFTKMIKNYLYGKEVKPFWLDPMITLSQVMELSIVWV